MCEILSAYHFPARPHWSCAQYKNFLMPYSYFTCMSGLDHKWFFAIWLCPCLFQDAVDPPLLKKRLCPWHFCVTWSLHVCSFPWGASGFCLGSFNIFYLFTSLSISIHIIRKMKGISCIWLLCWWYLTVSFKPDETDKLTVFPNLFVPPPAGWHFLVRNLI